MDENGVSGCIYVFCLTVYLCVIKTQTADNGNHHCWLTAKHRAWPQGDAVNVRVGILFPTLKFLFLAELGNECGTATVVLSSA